MKFLQKRILLLFIFLFACTFSGFTQEFTTLQGKIIDKKIDSLYIHKVTGDVRLNRITVPVKDGQFRYKTKENAVEAYEVIYPYQHQRGAWKAVTFFMEPGKIQFSLHPEKPSKNVIQGGKWNDEFNHFTQVAEKRFRNPARKLSKELNASKSKDTSLLKSKMDSLKKGFVSHHTDYIKESTNPVSYYLLYENIESNRFNIPLNLLEKSFQKHSEQLPNHPYSSVIQTILNAKEQIEVGNRYIDFQAPDLNGEQKRLSNLIDGKIALLNLWASWCGPCIRKSREMVPIFKKYHSDEFTMIGVAREFDNTNRLEKALQREEFPWKNLVDIDDKHNIWRKYDIPFTGGGMFLIDKEGKILAVNPTVKEVRKILTNRL